MNKVLCEQYKDRLIPICRAHYEKMEEIDDLYSDKEGLIRRDKYCEHSKQQEINNRQFLAKLQDIDKGIFWRELSECYALIECLECDLECEDILDNLLIWYKDTVMAGVKP